MNNKVSFTEMKHGTREDYELLAKLEKPFIALTADRILVELKQAGNATLEGYRITRLEPVSYTHLTLPTTVSV